MSISRSADTDLIPSSLVRDNSQEQSFSTFLRDEADLIACARDSYLSTQNSQAGALPLFCKPSSEVTDVGLQSNVGCAARPGVQQLPVSGVPAYPDTYPPRCRAETSVPAPAAKPHSFHRIGQYSSKLVAASKPPISHAPVAMS